jgi:ABC-type nickel/cobalt efflux system permease component RcnA
MTQLSDLLQQGGGNAWPFIPSAIPLGALRGAEPGHSKTTMAAFNPQARPQRWAPLVTGASEP